ncbi:MAG: peroxidase family protein, partial [Bdellovibrionales bacterium]|nr:peroxidase family protein [Bdellovibrionales bacterium]
MIRKIAFLALLGLLFCSCDSSRGSRAAAGEVRSFDGSSNSLVSVDMGKAGVELLRFMDARYEDGVGEPMVKDMPNPRTISNKIFAQSRSIPNKQGLTSIVWQWGQFIDHDMDLSPESDPTEFFSITIPAGDKWFDPQGTGKQQMSIHRSIYSTTGGVRQQMNMISAWIDASNVYGFNQARADWLRSKSSGKLKVSEGNMLPFNDGTQVNAGRDPFSKQAFVAGDVRANEQLGLIAFHTLFVREHNRLAIEIAKKNPEFTDEQVYQRARKFVGAYLQSITFNEFLPALLGPHAPRAYSGYNNTIDPSIMNEFSTAIFRLGHSMVATDMLRRDELGNPIPQGDLKLRDAFFRPDKIFETGIDPFIAGLAHQTMEEVDAKIVDDLRNMLFGPPGAGGLDLATLNIMRGREHGLPDYNSLRAVFGLETLNSFDEITSNSELAKSLEETYGDINNIDAWVGALSEDHIEGGNVGQLVAVGILKQLTSL